MNMELTEVSETSAYKIRRRGITQKKEHKSNIAAHFLAGSVLNLEAGCSDLSPCQAMSRRIILK
jgi:hypothetical protein